MRLTTFKTLMPCMVLALALVSSGRARADLTVSIVEDGSTLLYTNSVASLQSFNVPDGTYGDFNFSGFNINSSQASNQGQLGTSGTITSAYVNPSDTLHTLTIAVSDTGYTTPVGPGYQLDSSAGYTFLPNNSPNPYTDTLTFQSSGTANAIPPGTSVLSPGEMYSFNDFGTSPPVSEAPSFFTATGGYSLGETYVWTSNGSGDSLSVDGSTTATGVASVPEPSALVLLGLGSVGLVAIRRRRLV